METDKYRLKELLKEGEKLKEDDVKSQSAWEKETKMLIDMLSGPGLYDEHH